jgi:Mn2+/Fe2+ NRAMP family transporter
MAGTAEPVRAQRSAWLLLGPGLLLAATGVGGGDLATGSIAGSLLGTAVLWAAVLGAALKFVVTEGLARWQLATGETLLEGAVARLGPVVVWLFLPYLLLWSFFVGSAMMSACGIALHAILPVFDDSQTARVVFGAAAGVSGLLLVLRGGYALFGWIMRLCIGVMFVTVMVTAATLWPGSGAVLEGLLAPRIPTEIPGAVTWTVALIGGVGGTLTVLAYGYWLREEGRTSPAELRNCRIDLGVGYVMTGLFGVAMIIVGNSIVVEGQGTGLLIDLAARLEEELGGVGKWLFLAGTFGTVFSSLLGVWQSVPYLFADCVRLLGRRGKGRNADAVDTTSTAYRGFLFAIAFVPMLGLFVSFREVQKIYTVTGALFFPLLALVLLVFNGRTSWVGRRFKNGPLAVAGLLGVLALFSWIAIANIETS